MSVVTNKLLPKSSVDLMAFILVFDFTSWAVLLVFILLISVTMTGMDLCFNGKQQYWKNLGSLYLYTLQTGDIQPDHHRTLTQRVVTLTTLTLMYIFYNYYTAFLTSLMSLKGLPGELNSFQDLLDQDYTMVIIKASYAHSVMTKTARDHIGMAQLVSQMDPSQDHLSDYDTVYRRLLSSKSASLLTLLDTRLAAPGTQYHHSLENHFPSERTGLSYPLDSEFEELMSYHLHMARESGTLRKVLQKWDVEDNGELTPLIREVATPFALQPSNLAFLGIIISGGCGFSVIICLLECVVHKLNKLF